MMILTDYWGTTKLQNTLVVGDDGTDIEAADAILVIK